MHAHLFFHIHILLAYARTHTPSHVPQSRSHAHTIQCYCRDRFLFLLSLGWISLSPVFCILYIDSLWSEVVYNNNKKKIQTEKKLYTERSFLYKCLDAHRHPLWQKESNYSRSHLFYAKLWTVADQKPMVKKIWKKYEKSWDGLPSSPKSKRGQKPFGILP